MDRDPARVEARAIGVERDLVGRVERRLRRLGDRRAGRVQDLQHLEPPVRQVARVLGDEPVDEAVRHLRNRGSLVGAARVLAEPEVAVLVVLDALVRGISERADEVDDRRGVAGRGGVDRRASAELGREQQALRERVPRRAVDLRQVRAGRVPGRHQRHAVCRVGVEVDARDVAGRAGLVPLEQEVRPVPVARVGPGQALLEDQVRVLVRLCLWCGPRASGSTPSGPSGGRRRRSARRCRSRSRRPCPASRSRASSSPARPRSAAARPTACSRGHSRPTSCSRSPRC